jgi:sigma-B regulation protein RsbU (phosphoserine phosphatase)
MNNAHSSNEHDRLNLALRAAHMGTWDWDVKEGTVRLDNQMREIFGLSPEAFGGRCEDFLGLVHENDRERIHLRMAAVLADCFELDDEFLARRTGDGAIRHIRLRATVQCDENRQAISMLGVAWDVTDRRRTEAELDRERNLLVTLMDHLPDNIYFKDLDSRFIAVNRYMAHWAGRQDPSELVGLTDQDLFTNEHAGSALSDEQTIIRTGLPIINHEEKETWPDRSDTWVSTTKLPLRDPQGKVIGTFGLSRDITARKLADEKLARLTAELRARNKALQEDLEMARELQTALMPQQYPRFPHGVSEQESAVRFYHFFQPSGIVSGDFFDVLDISDSMAGLFICDVMGHGVRAALVAATIRTLVSELRPYWDEPGEFLTRLNRGVADAIRHSPCTLFATAFYVVADLSRGELRYANAGHPCPLRVTHGMRNSSAFSAPLDGQRPGLALGLLRDALYRTQHGPLSPRDVLLLFTDGLFEVENAGGQLYDYHQLSRAVGDRTRLPTGELCRSLVADVRQFSADREFSDDVCLVAMDIERVGGQS